MSNESIVFHWQSDRMTANAFLCVELHCLLCAFIRCMTGTLPCYRSIRFLSFSLLVCSWITFGSQSSVLITVYDWSVITSWSWWCRSLHIFSSWPLLHCTLAESLRDSRSTERWAVSSRYWAVAWSTGHCALSWDTIVERWSRLKSGQVIPISRAWANLAMASLPLSSQPRTTDG